MRTALAVFGVALLAGEANADRREASLHAHVVGGVAISGDQASETSASAPLGGLAVRASFATSNAFQYDLSIAVLATSAAGFPEATFGAQGRPPVTGPYTISTQATRLDGGVTFRLGVAWIPTVRLAVGGQIRRRGGPVVEAGGAEVTGEERLGRNSELGFDLVGTAGVGLDHRVNRRLLVGAAIGASMAVPVGGESFMTAELTAHAAYYWYPR